MLSFDYLCSECGQDFDIVPGLMLCPQCSSVKKADEPLRGVLEVRFQGKAPSSFESLDLLPVEREHFPDLPCPGLGLQQDSR